jgi:hypothetical protein
MYEIRVGIEAILPVAVAWAEDSFDDIIDDSEAKFGYIRVWGLGFTV